MDRPLKQFAGIVERASFDLRNKLDSYNKEREENHSKRISQEGFLSDLWDENEMNESDIKIKMLKEDINDLTKEPRVKNRSLSEAQEQVERLRKEKIQWQELYLNSVPAKRSAEDTNAHPFGDKRSRKEEHRGPERQSSSVEKSDSTHREGSRWDVKPILPCGESLSYRRKSEIVVDLWKEQCRKLNRCIPNKPQSGPNVPYPQGFNHSFNISFVLTAASNFKRVTESMQTWKEKQTSIIQVIRKQSREITYLYMKQHIKKSRTTLRWHSLTGAAP